MRPLLTFICLLSLVPQLAVGAMITNLGAGADSTAPTWVINSDATGAEPADGSGLIIEGGSGDVGIRWDATNNEIDVTGPTGTRLSLPDPGDGSRTIEQLDNTSEPTAPAAASTILYPLGGEWYKKDNGDGTTERLIYNSGNYGVISRTVTPFTVNGDDEGVTATNAWTYSVPGGTLGTTRTLRVTISGRYQNTGTAGYYHFRVYYGGTLVWGEAGFNETINPWRAFTLTFYITNTTSTSAQIMHGTFAGGDGYAADYGTGAVGRLSASGNSIANFRGTSAVDSTTAKDLVLSVQLPNTEATSICHVETAMVELL